MSSFLVVALKVPICYYRRFLTHKDSENKKDCDILYKDILRETGGDEKQAETIFIKDLEYLSFNKTNVGKYELLYYDHYIVNRECPAMDKNFFYIPLINISENEGCFFETTLPSDKEKNDLLNFVKEIVTEEFDKIFMVITGSFEGY